MKQKVNAENSLKNLKNNIVKKKPNRGLEQDSASSSKAESNNDKLNTLKNYKEIADIPEIKNLIPNNNNNNNYNTKVNFPTGNFFNFQIIKIKIS
jgi:ketol-acid reductoisomerase